VANILYVKLVLCAEETIGEYQGGFRRVRPTLDHIFIMRHILEKCGEQNIAVLCLFIDFQAAVTLCGERKCGVKLIN
jgi:hypothetical protein